MLQKLRSILSRRHVALKFGDGDSIHPTDIVHDTQASIEDIFYCFRLILGRSPHSEEWAGHSARAGENLGDIVRTYINSREFGDRKMLEARENQTIVKRHNGRFHIWADPQDTVIGSPSLTGSYEPHVTNLIENTLNDGDLFVDVGANIGYFSLVGALAVGPTGRVVSVEPNAENAKLLLLSKAANELDNIEVAQVAVSKKIEPIILHAGLGNGSTSRISDYEHIHNAKLVPAIPLDYILAQRTKPVRLIKIDVEGFEFVALSGAQSVINDDRPDIIFEFSASDLVETTPSAFLNWFAELGYELSPIHETGEPLVPTTAEEIMAVFEAKKSSHIDVLATHKDRSSAI
ncbi:FkbM family methyltransferase [Maritalea sp.]|uniref:FkbM family methyltransferase n=1 Tax=Maritalea sp. TaxID=2003361 RepID=UPI003EF2C3D4